MDLIERQAAIDELGYCQTYLFDSRDKDKKISLEDAEYAIEQLPSAQPEIVRCKDCKHRASYWGNCRLLEEKYHQSVLVDGNSFCSMAERRTDESD